MTLSDAKTPYIIPMAFGYRDNAIYLHSSRKGRKIKILKKNPMACFEADIETEVITANGPAS
ncbi:MAG: pyridoxamine 5'-phosphate oxidase family protein [Methanosarcina sp.]